MKYLKDENVRKKLFMGMVLIAFFFICYNIGEIWGWIKKLFNIMLPFVIGGAIAFVLNVPMRWVEKGILRDRKKFPGSKWATFRRVLSLIITLLLAMLLLTLLSYMIIPQLASTISQLIRQVPAGIKKLTVMAEEQFNNEPIIRQIIQELADDWQSILEKVMSILKDSVNGVLEGGYNAVTGIVSGFFNFIVGFIFSLYILVQKEKLGTQAKMILYALCDDKAADEVVAVAQLAEKTFTNFISGQCTEALILASMFSLSMTIMNLPYALLVGLLIGATSLIPIIGTFVGCIIGALLILLVDPMKALVFVILFIILQQIEGNLIYPKVVGDSVGLPGIWVLFSVTVGGSMFGVTGIIVFIPLVSVLYSLFRRYIYEKLQEKDIKDNFDYEEKFKRPTETAGKTLVKKIAERNKQVKKNDNRGKARVSSRKKKSETNKPGNSKPENK